MTSGGRKSGKPEERSSSLIPFREIFALDIRSLALLRIGLGLLLLYDWIDRLPYLRVHYSDDGVLPRGAIDGVVPFSLQMFSGAVWFQAVLAGVALVAAALLTIGWRTPLMTFVCWLLLLGVHGRNVWVLHSGDMLFRLTLFWGMFLPLGARWSVDSADARSRTNPATATSVRSLATVVFVVQLCLVYYFAAAWKWGPEWRVEGTAVSQALSIAWFTTRFGLWLREQIEICRFLTYSTLLLEVIGPTLLFLPFSVARQRLLVIAAFLLFHVGLAVSIELGQFPWICCVVWLALLPSSFWECLGRRLNLPRLVGWTIVYDRRYPRTPERLELLRTFLVLDAISLREEIQSEADEDVQGQRQPHGWALVDPQGHRTEGPEAVQRLWQLSPLLGWGAWLGRGKVGGWLAGVITGPRKGKPGGVVAGPPPWTPVGGTISQAVLGFGLIYIVLWNIRYFDYERNRYLFPDKAVQIGLVLGVDQGWGLFAPRPTKYSGWYLMLGTQRDGTEVDLFRGGGPVDRERPALPSLFYPTTRWRAYVINLPSQRNPWVIQAYCQSLYRDWNRTHQGVEAIRSVEIIWMREENTPPGTPTGPAEVVSLVRYEPSDETP